MFNFFINNYLDDADLEMISGTENAQYPLSNLKLNFTTKTFRSNESSCSILIDLKATRPVDSFIIVGNALGSFGLNSIKLYGSPTQDFGPSTERVVQFSAEHNVGYLLFSEAQEFRFWKLELVGVPSFVEVANFFIGQKATLADNGLSANTFRFRQIDLSQVSKNDYNQQFVDRRNKVTQISGEFQLLLKDEYDILLQVYNDHGNHTPIWVILDPDSCLSNNGRWLYTGFFWIVGDMDATLVPPQLFNIPLRLEQVI